MSSSASTEDQSPTTPLIHINGSDPGTLAEQYLNACVAINVALQAVEAAAPHARDYYPIDGLWPKAREEHIARMKKLQKIHAELQYLGLRCLDAQKR